MAQGEPLYHEDSKGDVTGCSVVHIFEHFCCLGYVSGVWGWAVCTYGENQVTAVHDDEYGIADFVVVVSVGTEHQGASYDVVGEHLPMVLASLFNIDHDDLLDPECELD